MSLILFLLVVLLAACGGSGGRPADSHGREIVEADGTLSIHVPGAAPRRLVGDTAGGFVRSELAAKQREGLVILYWAAAPVPSPDGRRVAYVTNREAVRAGTAGQSIWIVNHAHRRRAAAGQRFRPLVPSRGLA